MTARLNGRALIVDDDPKALKDLAEMLEAEGLTIRSCPDAFAALEFIEREQFDVVITDISMPAVSGLELLVHAQRLDPDLPVILITELAEVEAAITAVKQHAFDFIMKPFDPDLFLSVIARALNYRHLRKNEREYASLLQTTLASNTEELKRQIEELRHSRDAAMESSRLKSEFISNISHELRTPLHGMVGLMELLTGQPHSPEQARYYAMMRTSVDRLSSLINNMLEFSKMSSGSFELSPRLFSLSRLVADLTDTYAVKAKAKGLALSGSVDPCMPDMIIADDMCLKQVIGNLLDNAVKFTQQGEICLTVRAGEETSYAGTGEIALFCSVSDTGIGIHPGEIGTIFEGFRQADGSFTRKHEGAGLGLAVAKQTVQSMGGSIWAESVQGSGSVFNFIVPVKAGGKDETADS